MCTSAVVVVVYGLINILVNQLEILRDIQFSYSSLRSSKSCKCSGLKNLFSVFNKRTTHALPEGDHDEPSKIPGGFKAGAS